MGSPATNASAAARSSSCMKDDVPSVSRPSSSDFSAALPAVARSSRSRYRARKLLRRGSGKGRLGSQPKTNRLWIEIALPSEHRRPHVLIVEESDRRPRRVGAVERWSLVRGVVVRVEHLEGDIELRHRVPLRARTDFIEAEIGI